jgi:hypothetical protein
MARNAAARGAGIRILVLLSVVLSTACTREPATTVSFNDTVQPILSENCYLCHGPDASTRKAGLRLDKAEFAYAPHEQFGPAIIPGKPDRSPLVKRIEASDPRERMPPPEAHKTLEPEEIALLRQWVQEGAEYRKHWAFIAPTRPTVPETADNAPHADWPHNPIDRFILARLEAEQLAPSPEADRHALIRRVTYDLTGLPPTPDEVDAFLDDRSPDAYEKVVDRLLANPRYGEHRARYWLDVARYGDTHGLHVDNFRSIWPYRDYVIKAYNENKAFDQFILEQLAGDLLPAESIDQLVATGYIRAGISTGEGGTIPEELRVNNQRERTEALGAAFLGLTTGCAACHDHKFDPVSQRDFYRLTAFFNNLDENPANQNREDWPPFVVVPQPERRDSYNAVLSERAEIQRQINARRLRADTLVANWLAQSSQLPTPVSEDALQVRLRFDEQQGSTFSNSAPEPAMQSVTATGNAPQWGEETWLWPSMRMDTSTRIELPEAGDFDTDQAFSVGFWVMPRDGTNMMFETQPNASVVSRVDSGQSLRGWELAYREVKTPTTGLEKADGEGSLAFNLFHDGDRDAITVATRDIALTRGYWTHVLATYDGSGKASGVNLYIDGAQVPAEILQDSLTGTIRTEAPLSFGRQYPDANALRDSRYQDFRLYARALGEEEAGRVAYEDYVSELAARPMDEWSEQTLRIVADFYFAERDAEMRALVAQVQELDQALEALAEGGAVSLVSAEKPLLAYADVLTRGMYNQRSERVRPGVPEFLPPLPAEAPLNRRGLADWLVSEANPLTTRVVVNRMWQEVFATGIVETSDDFGTVGARPSHPELLDWLAVDFREHGWDVKRFYKQLVMSATYRQTARMTPQLLAKDPENRLLARGPRFRMDAEMVRDTALAASGLLVGNIGGPSVKPYQPPGIWEAGSLPGSNTGTYEQDHGESLYRRSLYTFWKRTATAPNMDTYDVPMRDAACTRRQRTNTPLQALVTMNDPQWLEAARKLAERAIHAAAAPEARLDFIANTLLARPWNAAERSAFERTLEHFRDTYADDPAAAQELIAVGESPRDEHIAATELAPWMLVASAALNLDAVLNK